MHHIWCLDKNFKISIIIHIVVETIIKNITPHGGMVPILKKIRDNGIPELIRSHLGERLKQSRYGHDDIFISWIITALCGGKRLEHINNIKDISSIIPNLKIPSPDTLGRVMKKLAAEISTHKNINQKNAKAFLNDYDNNLLLNKMLVAVTKQIGALKEGQNYTLDIDATFIETNCVGANISNEKEKNGFHPMVCLIGNLPVYICMRNGRANAKFYLKESLEQCLDILKENNINVTRVISDGAAYSREVTNMLHARGLKFNIHAPINFTFKTMMGCIKNCKEWKAVDIETGHGIRSCEITSFPYSMTYQKNKFRIVAAKVSNRKTKARVAIEKKMKEMSKRNLLKIDNKTYALGKWKVYKGYKYKLTITNDYDLSDEELLIEYNKRGNAERQFSFMKKDFGWKLPPFKRMNENTVFMIAAALANNVFRGVMATFKEKLPEIKLTYRRKTFQKLFIDVICLYTSEIYEFINPKFDYKKIM